MGMEHKAFPAMRRVLLPSLPAPVAVPPVILEVSRADLVSNRPNDPGLHI